VNVPAGSVASSTSVLGSVFVTPVEKAGVTELHLEKREPRVREAGPMVTLKLLDWFFGLNDPEQVRSAS
jgi:hypothetical protein